jgi:ABC-2 type transport system permease protein
MFATILTLVRKEITGFRKDRTAVMLTFLVPIVLIYIFGNVFGVNRGSSGPTGIPLAIVATEGSPAINSVIAALATEEAFSVRRTWTDEAGTQHPLTEERVRADIKDNKLRFALVFPDDALSDERFGLRVRLLYNPRNDIETQTVMGLLQKNIYTAAPSFLFASLRKRAENLIGVEDTEKFYDSIADAVSNAFDIDREDLRASMAEDSNPFASAGTGDGAADFMTQIVDIDQEQLTGRAVKNASATRMVGGWAIMFLLFSVAGSSTSLFDEKKAGIFNRLLSMPVTRAQILWSKFAFNVLMGLVQLLFLFIAGRVLFGIDVASNLPSLVVVCICAASACTAFGMLLAAVSKSTAAASGLGTFLILTMSAVGGAWFPVSFMPEFLQTLSKLTLVYWAQEGFIAALWAGSSIVEMLPILGVLLGMAAILNTISLILFRRGAMFS